MLWDVVSSIGGRPAIRLRGAPLNAGLVSDEWR